MNRQEILYWANMYDKENYEQWVLPEKELGNKFRQTQEVTKADLIAVVEWKFLGNPLWKQRRLNDVQYIDDKKIREKSHEVFTQAQTDLERVNGLRFKGVGTAIASVILTFYNPKEYGVFDRHVWQGLFGDQPSEFFDYAFYADAENYLKVLERLRDDATIHELDVRTVEKAYFNKHLHQPKRKRY